MRVLLINPSLRLADVGHYSKVVEKQRGIYPPLGLAYVASALEKNNHAVKVIDCDADILAIKNISEIAEDFRPEIVGMYVMTWTFRQANYLLKKIKNKLKNVKFIIGGPNVTSFPAPSLKHSEFDYAVIGEGEITTPELIDAIEKKKKVNEFRKIKGIVFRDKNKIIVNPSRNLIEKLDDIPFPAWHLLPIDNYFDIFTRKRRFVTIISSRGCPFNCTYCDRLNRMGKRWRSRSPKNIVDEIEFLYNKYKIREFMFFDDNFIVNKNRVYELCNEILRRKLKILWECRARVDMVDFELLKRMKKAGCYRIRYGMEAGDNKILKIMKKGITVEQVRKAAIMTKKAGIEVFAYFMMGSPGEDHATLKKTLRLAIEIKPDFVAFSKTIIIMGSELFDWGVQNRQIKKDYWERFLVGEEKNPAPGISTKKLPEGYVNRFVSYSEKRFYLRPSYLIKRLKSIRSITQFYRQFYIFILFIYSKIFERS